jgi:hypothetical protein
VATTSWTRLLATGLPWNNSQQNTVIVKLNSGQTIERCHLTWGFGGSTSTLLIPTATQGNLAALGLVTTIGNGLESPPDPISAPNNAAPPSRRWIYWSARAPVIAAWDTANYTAIWTSSPAEEDSSTKGQVLAPTGMGTGNTLNLQMTWRSFATWDGSGQAVLWFACSVLVRTP